MRFTLTSLVRLIAFVALGLSLFAVGLSRAVPRVAEFRVATPPRYYGVNGSAFSPPDKRNFLLDTETGGLIPLAQTAGASVDYASCSPWRDEKGNVEIAGRVTNLSGRRGEKLYQGSGLALFKLPGVPSLNELSVEPVVSGRPCWLPSGHSKVLYPAGDGELYVQQFNREAGAEDSTPQMVKWRCEKPGDDRVFVSDPIWPTTDAVRGGILVSLNATYGEGKSRFFGRSEIWWLKLDPESRYVEAARRVTAAADPKAAVRDERLPNLMTIPDGRTVLAYLTRNPGDFSWRLTLAPVEIDPESGAPGVVSSEVRDLADDCMTTTPAFSADGRWVYRVSRDSRSELVVRRFDVVDALGDRFIKSAQADVRGSRTR